MNGESSQGDDPPPSSRLDNHRRDDEDGNDYDSERRGHRSCKEDTWSARIFRSLSRAPSERYCSSSCHGLHCDVEYSGRRRVREGRCGAATSTQAVKCSTCRVRGRSLVRRFWRRVEPRTQLSPRASRAARSGPGSNEDMGGSYHPSPQPPRMRADPKLCTKLVSATQLQETSAQHVDNNLGMHLSANAFSDVHSNPSMKENCYNDPAARCLIPIQDVFRSIWSSLSTYSRSMERGAEVLQQQHLDAHPPSLILDATTYRGVHRSVDLAADRLVECLFRPPARTILLSMTTAEIQETRKTVTTKIEASKATPTLCHRLHTVNTTTVRRSVRLAKSCPMHVIQRAQRNLCRKLGLLNNESNNFEAALQKFLTMFQRTQSLETLAALTSAFNLKGSIEKSFKAAMIAMMGAGVADRQEGIGSLRVEELQSIA
jgi:hypothetical protein